MTPRIAQISQEIQRRSEHALAHEQIGRVDLAPRQVRDPLREGQRDPVLHVADAIGPQAAERTQSILGVVKPVGNRKSICPGRTNLETRTFRK